MLKLLALATVVELVAGHASMINPPPRQAHGQKFDAANKCDCDREAGGCYSNITQEAQYCGLGCLGEACLYYQIGCFANCGTCSYTGKDLYPSAEDLRLAGDCKPIEPTLPAYMRSYNIDNESTLGDWSKVNPWRAPGTSGMGNPDFQPCGVNSGWRTATPSRGSAGPGAGGQPVGANGIDLPAGVPTAWKAGSVQDVSFSIYANHGGGYAYRLCKVEPGVPLTEECFQKMPLDFATNTTTIKYQDGSKAPFQIPGVTTSVGTYPPNSQWRRNPVPMCNCDQGAYCQNKEGNARKPKTVHRHLMDAFKAEGKTCKAVTRAECGTDTGVNSCLKCAEGSSYDCTECCPGCESTTTSGYTYCACKGPPGPPPPPSPPSPPSPGGGTYICYQGKCYNKPGKGTETKAQCDATCGGSGPSPPPPPGPPQYTPYKNTHFRPGQTSEICPSGLMFNSSWDEGVGSGPIVSSAGDPQYGHMNYEMIDQIKVPTAVGRYVLSWRWDCEQTPQVWNSCSDIVIV